MSTNKKYYWMKLKDNFFDTEEMVLLQNTQDGYLYSDILLKMYLRSLKGEGRLMLNDRIPYDAQMIATITRHQVGTVDRALKAFENLGLIEVLDNKAIYMLDIQSLIGEGSSEADRKKAYRERMKTEQLLLGGGHLSGLSSPEIELELKLEKEKDITTVKTQKIKLFADCYLGYTGETYRKVKKDINWNPTLCELSDDDFISYVHEFLEDDRNEGKLTIEYFNTVCDRYR
jgi:predicted phage replisome organizer